MAGLCKGGNEPPGSLKANLLVNSVFKVVFPVDSDTELSVRVRQNTIPAIVFDI